MSQTPKSTLGRYFVFLIVVVYGLAGYRNLYMIFGLLSKVLNPADPGSRQDDGAKS